MFLITALLQFTGLQHSQGRLQKLSSWGKPLHLPSSPYTNYFHRIIFTTFRRQFAYLKPNCVLWQISRRLYNRLGQTIAYRGYSLLPFPCMDGQLHVVHACGPPVTGVGAYLLFNVENVVFHTLRFMDV